MKKQMLYDSKNLFWADTSGNVKIGDKGFFADTIDDIIHLFRQYNAGTKYGRNSYKEVLDVLPFNGVSEYVFRNNTCDYKFFYRIKSARYVNISTVDDLLRLFNRVPSYQRNILKIKDYEIFLPILGFNKEKNSIAISDPSLIIAEKGPMVASIIWVNVKNLKNMFTLANGTELLKVKN